MANPFVLIFLLCTASYGAESSKGLLHQSIRSKFFEAACEIIKERSTDINEIFDGNAPLHLATRYGFYNVVFDLVKNGAQVNQKNIDGETAAIIALKNQNVEILNHLLEWGARIKIADLIDIMQIKKTDAPINVPTHDIFEILSEILWNEDQVNIVLYLYPFFMDDRAFFTKISHLLKDEKIPKAQVFQLLWAFIKEDFPEGLPSFEALKCLPKWFNSSDPAWKLRGNIFTLLYSKYDPQKALNNDMPVSYRHRLLEFIESYHRFSETKMAQAITKRDAHVFADLSLKEITEYFYRGNSTGSLKKCIKFYNVTVQFFALVIVYEQDESRRKSIAEKLVVIAEEFYKLKNFWGVIQITSALSTNEARRVLDLKTNHELAKRLSRIESYVTPLNDYGCYQQELLKLNHHQACLPLISVFLRDLTRIKEIKPSQLNKSWVKSLGSLVCSFWHLKNRSHRYGIASEDYLGEMFTHLPSIKGGVLAEFSHIIKPWSNKSDVVHNTDTAPINSWSCLDMITFFDNRDISKEFSKDILKAGIFTGKDLDQILTTDLPPNDPRYELLNTIAIILESNMIPLPKTPRDNMTDVKDDSSSLASLRLSKNSNSKMHTRQKSYQSARSRTEGISKTDLPARAASAAGITSNVREKRVIKRSLTNPRFDWRDSSFDFMRKKTSTTKKAPTV